MHSAFKGKEVMSLDLIYSQEEKRKYIWQDNCVVHVLCPWGHFQYRKGTLACC